MDDEEPLTPAVKSAVHFFNNLNRGDANKPMAKSNAARPGGIKGASEAVCSARVLSVVNVKNQINQSMHVSHRKNYNERINLVTKKCDKPNNNITPSMVQTKSVILNRTGCDSKRIVQPMKLPTDLKTTPKTGLAHGKVNSQTNELYLHRNRALQEGPSNATSESFDNDVAKRNANELCEGPKSNSKSSSGHFAINSSAKLRSNSIKNEPPDTHPKQSGFECLPNLTVQSIDVSEDLQCEVLNKPKPPAKPKPNLKPLIITTASLIDTKQSDHIQEQSLEDQVTFMQSKRVEIENKPPLSKHLGGRNVERKRKNSGKSLKQCDSVKERKCLKKQMSAVSLVEPYDTFVIKSDAFKDNSVLVACVMSSNVVKKACAKKLGLYRKIQVRTTNLRSDAFLEPYLQGLGERQSPGVGAPSPSPPPACKIAPFLLPTPASRSPSRESLISSNGGSDAGSEDSGDTGYGAACDIGLVERLIRSHPIWFLPGIQRAGAFHLLQGKEEGCFVVRQSSQTDTMALSVRLPPDKGPYIEHYLIQSSSGGLGLETSENRFDNMPALIAHYANCCDELPVQLTLPKAIREARTRQQLSSLALLGQEFWRYSPPPSASSSPDAELVLNLNPLMSTFKTAEPSTPVTKDVSKPARPNTLNLINNVDPAKTEQKIEPIKCISSFKNEQTKVPPPPPPRWSKPTTPQNNFTVTTTVTFSVNSQSPRNEQPASHMEILCDPKRMSPEGQTSTMSSKGSLRRAQEQITSPNGSILSPNSDPNSIVSPDTLSPLSVTKTARHSRRAKQKVSKHYQESDILESPTVYYRSAVGDKISDYEDLWSNEQTNQKTKNSNGGSFASPDLLQHTGTVVSLNNNVLSPTDSQTGSQHSHCSTPIGNQISSSSSIQSPAGDSSNAAPQESANSPKQSSPFYAEPADSLAQTAVPRRLFNKNLVPMQQRHSNPAVLHSHSPLSPGLERVESLDFNGTMSSSVDNLSPKQRLIGIKKPEVKAVLPPSVKPRINDNWQVDSSWKFMGNEGDVSIESSDPDYDSDWPATIPHFHLSQFAPDNDDRISIQEMISRRFPDIRMSADTTDDELCRMSAYDNVDDRRLPRAPPSEISELTEFSDPWAEITHTVTNTEAEDSSFSENCNPPHRTASVNRSQSFKDRLDPLLSAPRLKALRSRDQGDSRAVGAGIRNYALELANDKTTTFAQNIDNFIACTCESRENNPQIVMRNMRQFMSGMKNYLVKHGEKGFDKEVERERNKLKSTEFLNLDAILEGVLHCLVVTPLKKHLQNLFIEHYRRTGAIRLLADNIHYANTRPISELAIKPKITLPTESALQTISQFLSRLQAADSPLEKLEYLLAAIATIFNSVKTNQLTGSGRNITLGADDFLPLFVWVLVKTNFVAAEIEADYMWGLLHPSLLSGEGGYYLTTLSSAVHILKNFKESNEENVKNNLKSDVSVLKSVLKVVVPDELHGSILTKTLPARPHMTTKEVCKIIAHKARITNPQDFALYRLVDGEETMLGDNECPQEFMSEGKHVMLAYKRIDAKIAWPKQQSN